MDWSNEKECLERVKQNGYALQYVETKTPEMCLEAVKQNGYAFKFVPSEFQSFELCMEAIKQHIFTLGYVKKQRTWFKRNKNAIWVSDPKEILYLASNFILKE